MQRVLKSILLFKLPFAVLGCLLPIAGKAQITPDGTTLTTVNREGDNFTIEQGDRLNSNLFHSFENFSVPSFGSAIFNNANDIKNIFSRVTGGNISNVDGLMGANGSANLFLINPNGIIFGENASLNLGGAFFATTADSILFDENQEFSASNSNTSPLLEVNIPIGFNFRDNPGDIVNRSIVSKGDELLGIEVTSGNNLTFLGGNIIFETGQATTRGGNIYLGGLSKAGIVGINSTGSLNFPENIARADIDLSNGSDIDVRSIGGGSITINARNLNLEAGVSGISFIRAGIMENSISSNSQAGNIIVNAMENIFIDESSILNTVELNALGNAGNTIIQTRNLSLNNKGEIKTSTSGRGDAGFIEIIATDSISIDGIEGSDNNSETPSNISSEIAKNGIGNAGGGNITTKSLLITNRGRVSGNVSGQGNVGLISINAENDIRIIGNGNTTDLDFLNFNTGVLSQVNLKGDGNVAGIEINTKNLTLIDGGRISANSLGKGNAGLIQVFASDSINIDGSNPVGLSFSGITSEIKKEGEGNSKGINVTAKFLNLINGGGISANTFGLGNAGLIQVFASDSIKIDGSGSLDGDEFSITNSSITSEVGSTNAGNSQGIKITTNFLSLTNGGEINASTSGVGNSGFIEITANDSIKIDGNSPAFIETPSTIKSQVNKGALGNSEEIRITSNSLSLTNGGRISTNTLGRGNAGNIIIDANESIVIKGIASDIVPSERNNGGEDGFSSGIFAQALINRGNGGNIILKTDRLSINDMGGIAVGNFDRLESFDSGSGEPGNININAGPLILNNQGRIDAITQSNTGDGANINLKIDDIRLQNNSFISAQALREANGGNLTIDTDFIIAFPNQNNDIVANADRGNGGNIDIITQSLFGIEERPLNSISNDINASSEFGIQGNIVINSPSVDPATGILELPQVVGDSSDQISQNPCEQGVGSELFNTGKGGLPPNPNDTIENREVSEIDLVEIVPFYNNRENHNTLSKIQSTEPKPQPAKGWIFNSRGQVQFTTFSNVGEITSQSQKYNHSLCSNNI